MRASLCRSTKRWLAEATRRQIPEPDLESSRGGRAVRALASGASTTSQRLSTKPTTRHLPAAGGPRLRGHSVRRPRELACRIRAAGRRTGTRLVSELLYAPGSLVSARGPGVGRPRWKLGGDTPGPSGHGIGRGPDADPPSARDRAGSRSPVPPAETRASSAGTTRRSCCATHCCSRFGGGRDPFGASVRSRSSRGRTNSCRCSWRSSSTRCACSSRTTSG